MNVWSKMVTALRGGMHEMGENVVDSQALRILDQEIRDADVELRRSKEALAEIMAKYKLAAEQVKKMSEKVAEYEGYALQALEGGKEDLAHDVALKIAQLEKDMVDVQEQAADYQGSVERLREAVTLAEAHIRRLKQQVDTVKATESVQKAQMAVAQRYGGSQAKLQTAVESLERIKKKQAERSAKMDAAAELAQSSTDEDDGLNKKLRDAGIVPDSSSADSVLARLKAKASGGGSA